MSAALSQIPWQTLLAGGLVTGLLAGAALVFRAIITGALVPRSVLEAEERRADKWEQAWRESEARADAIDGRLQAIAEASATSAQLLESLTHRARR